MGLTRKVKRNQAKKVYRKFSKQWSAVRSAQKEQLETGQSVENKLGKKPPFKNWFNIVARNLGQATATPEEVKEFVADVQDLDWEQETTEEKK